MPIDELWYHADRAVQRAEQAYHRLSETYDRFMEHEDRRSVSRERFKTLTERVKRTGAPYGAHSIVYNTDRELLLVRHDGVDLWVLPGGEVHESESFREAAARELQEEAGVDAEFQGLAMLTKVSFSWSDHEAWGVLPIFAAKATERATTVADPDDEISVAKWFDDLPPDTRDRQWIDQWRKQAIGRA